MRPINAKALFFISLAVSIVALLIAKDSPYLQVVKTISVIIISVGFILMLLFWRCPNCKKSLPAREFFIDYCPHCGHKID
ncbi:MAG: hypothetical protein QMB63_00520 [Clostridiaceae bacterium]